MIVNASIWGQWVDLANNSVFLVTNAGAPTNGTSGTGAGLTGPGSLLMDNTNNNLYMNTNTKASPTWTQIGGTSGGTFVSPTITTPTIAFNAQSVAAAGTNQSTAVAITAGAPANILVTAADSTKGARLPAATAGAAYFLKNSDVANAVLKVYPATGDTINALSANSSLDMAAKTSAVFMCVVAGAWLTIPLLPS